MCMFILLLSRIVISVHMPLVPVFCFIVAHSSLAILCTVSSRTLAIEWLCQCDASADPKW
jgi:hypothetical protein